MGRDALIVVDPQRDFFKEGAMPIPDAEEIIPNLNKLAKRFELVFVSLDWHPEETVHFERFARHCVQGTEGAMPHPDLKIEHPVTLLKGTWDDEDGLSAFDGKTAVHQVGLTEMLEILGVDHLYICGLATDYCVLATVRGAVARELPFVTVVSDAVRAIGDNDEALKVLNDFDRVEFKTTDEIMARSSTG